MLKFDSSIYDKNNWLKSGLVWGVIMFLLMSVCYPLITDESITVKSFLIGLIVYSVGGITFGFVMKLYFKKVNKHDIENLE
jgi:predicted ABC-type exoprotein transport system permease subunit